MKQISVKGVEQVVAALVRSRARRATKYISPKLVLSACVPAYGGKAWDGRDKRTTFVVKLGAPNYAERDFIKLCKKTGVAFPVKKVQLKFLSRGH